MKYLLSSLFLLIPSLSMAMAERYLDSQGPVIEHNTCNLSTSVNLMEWAQTLGYSKNSFTQLLKKKGYRNIQHVSWKKFHKDSAKENQSTCLYAKMYLHCMNPYEYDPVVKTCKSRITLYKREYKDFTRDFSQLNTTNVIIENQTQKTFELFNYQYENHSGRIGQMILNQNDKSVSTNAIVWILNILPQCIIKGSPPQ